MTNKTMLSLLVSICLISSLSCGPKPQPENSNTANSNTSQPAEGSQQEKGPATKIEAFLTKKGELVVKNFYALGTINGKYQTKAEFSAAVVYEPGKEAERLKALRVEVTQPGSYTPRSNTSFLDMEEIEDLSKSLDYMFNLAKEWQGATSEDRETVFTTKGDFRIGFSQSPGGSKPGEMSAFILSGPTIALGVGCLLPVEELKDVKSIADKALQLLNEK